MCIVFPGGLCETLLRQPMAIKYFLVAILFVLFDVEVIFFYPYAVIFKDLGWSGFWAVFMFVSLFACGFIYIVKKGALKWEVNDDMVRVTGKKIDDLQEVIHSILKAT